MNAYRRCRIGLLATAVFCLMMTGGEGWAQNDSTATPNPPAPKIAIVDVEAAMRNSTAVKSAREQMNEISSKYKKEIENEEAELRRSMQELQQQSTILAPEALAQRRDDLRKKDAQLQQKARALRQAMDQGFRNTMQKIQAVLFEEVAKVAGDIGANLVLPRSQIIVAVDSFDITRQATERLNARLSEVTLTMEEKPPVGDQQGQPAGSR